MFRSYSARIAELAQAHPDRIALIYAAHGVTHECVRWAELDRTFTRWARHLADRGVDDRAVVLVALPNGPEHVHGCGAAWRLGAMVVAISAACTPAEREQFLEVAGSAGRPVHVISSDAAWPPDTRVHLAAELSGPGDETPLADRTPHPGRTTATGGTTGRPKIIVDPNPWGYRGESPLSTALGHKAGQRILVVGPLYHGGPFMLLHSGLLGGDEVVLMDRFDAGRAVTLIRDLGVEWVFLVPTHMQRILELPNVQAEDFASLGTLYHSAAYCPQPLKRRWIDLLGPERVMELYGANDALGATIIRGDEWLAHPGSVGRPFGGEIAILDEERRPVPAGEIGQIYMRMRRPLLGAGAGTGAPETVDPRAIFNYLGTAPPLTTADGFESVGDMGWLDADGFLYIADRRVDMIVTGGSNVYPAEVEAVLAEYPAVHDVAVIGLPDARWGRRVHAVLQLRANADPSATLRELPAFARDRLAAYKTPKTYEVVAELLRNEAGKLQRQRMMQERTECLAGAA